MLVFEEFFKHWLFMWLRMERSVGDEKIRPPGEEMARKLVISPREAMLFSPPWRVWNWCACGSWSLCFDGATKRGREWFCSGSWVTFCSHLYGRTWDSTSIYCVATMYRRCSRWVCSIGQNTFSALIELMFLWEMEWINQTHIYGKTLFR